MSDIDAWLDEADQAEPLRTEVTVCLRGDLFNAHASLVAELETKRVETLGGTQGVVELSQRIAAVEAEIETKSRTFTVECIGHKRWADLLAQHPPTKEQRLRGLDNDERTFPQAAIAASVVDPKLTPAQVEKIAAKAPTGEWIKLWSAVLGVNLGGLQAPKSQAAAAILRANDGSLGTPPTGASPAASSSDGSGDPSPPTSTTTTDA